MPRRTLKPPVNVDVSLRQPNLSSEYAKLAKAAYGGLPVDGYTINPKYSDRNKTLYERTDPDGTRRAFLSFRGTDLTSPRTRAADLGADALLALGLKHLSARFRGSARTAKHVVDEYGRDNTTLIGFSLGGAAAAFSHQRLGIEEDGGVRTYAFAPGVAPSDVIRTQGQLRMGRDVVTKFDPPGPDRLKLGSNARIYAAKGDFVSSLVPFVEGGTVQVVPKRTRNPHSLDNFID